MKYAAATLAALLAIACGVIWWLHHEQVATASQLVQAQAATIAADFEASAARADVKRITTYVDRLRVVHDTTTAIQMDIPNHVTPDTDRLYPLPVGFVRVHDAAASGVPLVPGTGDPDASRSTIAASAAAGVIVGNYGICHETAEQLSALQDWVHSRESAAP